MAEARFAGTLAAAVLAAAAAVLPAASAARAQASGPADEARYRACTGLADKDPESALEEAVQWRDTGGGAPAHHCLALALIRMGKFADAAVELDALAGRLGERNRRLRPAVLDQAGQAWLRARKPRKAIASFTGAIEAKPGNVEYRIDRALAYAAQGAYWEAVDDLNAAADLAPKRADIYTYRASAYRYLDSLELAETDVERALALAPDDPVALLERGIVRRLKGDRPGARADWLKVVTLAPDTPAAKAARTNLERLDVNPD